MKEKPEKRPSTEHRNQRSSLSLRAKMIFGFGMLSVAILILLQFAHQYGIPFTRLQGEYQQHQGLAVQHMNFVADLKKEQLERWMARRREDAISLAESRFVKAAVAELASSLSTLAAPTGSPGLVQEELAKHQAHERLVHELRLAKERHEPYQRIVVADAHSGLVLASTCAEDPGKLLSLPASDTNALPITATEAEDENGKVVLQLSRCICEGDTPLGVAIFTIDPDEAIFPMLKTGPELGKTGEAVLVGPDGRVATPLKFGTATGTRRWLFKSSGAASSVRPNNLGPPVQRDYRDANALAVFRRLAIAPEADWGLVVKQDAAEILAPLKESEKYTLLLGLIGLGLAVSLSCLAADHLARPLLNLSRTVELVRAGNLSARAEVPSGNDEIGVLAATFNTMVDRIERSHLELEGDVRARTAELRQANEFLQSEVLTRRQTEEALRRERDNFLHLLGSMKDGVYVVNQNYDVEYVNSTIEGEFGPVNGRKCYQYLHGRAEVCPWCRNGEVWQGRTVRWEWQSPRNGKTYDLLDTPSVNEDGSVSKLEIFRDITERKEAQEALRRANDVLESRIRERTAELVQANNALAAEVAERERAQSDLLRANQALKTLSACNQILVRAPNEAELLKRIVESIIQGTGYCCAWVGLLRHDERKSVEVAAHAGFNQVFFSSLELTWANNEAGQTPAAAAIRSARPVITRVQTGPCARHNAANLARASSMALPLVTSGQSLGVLMIYSSTPTAFEGDEICLLTELADDLAFGIQTLRTREEYHRAAAELHKWVEVFQRAGWGVAVGSADGLTLEMVNPAYARMHGYTASELAGRPIADMYAPESRYELAERRRLAQERGRFIFEARHRRKDGSTFPVLVDISTVRDESGEVKHRVVYTEDVTELKSLESRIVEISEREQQRIGHDLHDGLCQQLTGVGYLCDVLRDIVVQALPREIGLLDRIRQLLQNALNQAHGLAEGLHPVSPEPEALMAALQQLTAYFHQVYKVYASFECPAPVLIPNNTAAMHLYRIAQEAMNNAVKHGGSSRILVRLCENRQTITLSISDDGCGFGKTAGASSGKRGSGLGLETMRFRARSLGGTLELHHAENGGVLVTCTLPASSARQPVEVSNGF